MNGIQDTTFHAHVDYGLPILKLGFYLVETDNCQSFGSCRFTH